MTSDGLPSHQVETHNENTTVGQGRSGRLTDGPHALTPFRPVTFRGMERYGVISAVASAYPSPGGPCIRHVQSTLLDKTTDERRTVRRRPYGDVVLSCP